MNSKIIIGLVGTLASGKGAVKDLLNKEHQVQSCKFSDVFRDVLERLGVPISRENLQKISTVLRQSFGEDLLSRVIIKEVEKINSEIIIVDGIRRMSDIEHLKKLDNFFIISVDADSQIRYERMKIRNENEGDAEKSYQDFLEDEKSEADKDISEVMKIANFNILNNGTMEDLFQEVSKTIKEIKKPLK